MKISPAGIALITQFEGCALQAYPDASPRRIPTVGYGHTGAGVLLGQRITQERACTLLAADLVRFEAAVSGMVTVPVTQEQFDALVSFAYNLGTQALLRSTLLRMVNSGDFKGASNEFQRWAHAGGETLPGLIRRRAAERDLFDGPTLKHLEGGQQSVLGLTT